MVAVSTWTASAETVTAVELVPVLSSPLTVAVTAGWSVMPVTEYVWKPLFAMETE
jgi:hypothetical protein